MRFFSFVACFASMGLCYAGAAESVNAKKCRCHQVRDCCKPVKIKEGGCCKVGHSCTKPGTPGRELRPVFGRAVLITTTEPILVKEGDVLSSMTSRAAMGIEFKDGEFIVKQPGIYNVKFFAAVQVTNVLEKSSNITIGVIVNGEEVKTKELSAPSHATDAQYPNMYYGHENCRLTLNAGDKVALKVVKLSLPEGACGYFVSGSEGVKRASAGLFLHAMKGPKKQKA